MTETPRMDRPHDDDEDRQPTKQSPEEGIPDRVNAEVKLFTITSWLMASNERSAFKPLAVLGSQ